MKLTLAKEGRFFVVDDFSRNGAPLVGRGRTVREAIGAFFHSNQTHLGIQFEVDLTAKAAEMRRRKRELRKR